MIAANEVRVASGGLAARTMPRPIEISTGLAAVGLAVLVPTAAGDFRWGWALVVGAIAYLALVYAASRILEDRRQSRDCLLYTSPSPRDGLLSRMPSSA